MNKTEATRNKSGSLFPFGSCSLEIANTLFLFWNFFLLFNLGEGWSTPLF